MVIFKSELENSLQGPIILFLFIQSIFLFLKIFGNSLHRSHTHTMTPPESTKVA